MTTPDITIPTEVLEEVAKAICLHERDHDKDWPDYLGHARAACIAMIKAWPGMSVFPGVQCGFRETPPTIILPLPQEPNASSETPSPGASSGNTHRL